MLIWMCALHCEAKALIDFYRLRKSSTGPGFDLYTGDQIRCIVSGVGAMNMAAATAWAGGLYRQNPGLYFINLGVAGHKDRRIGELLRVSELISGSNPRVLHCQDPVHSDLPELPITSFDSEQSEYPQNRMVDMEAYAFLATARRFADEKWCQSLKVISDNQTQPASRDKNRISRLIEQQMPRIIQYAEELSGIEK